MQSLITNKYGVINDPEVKDMSSRFYREVMAIIVSKGLNPLDARLAADFLAAAIRAAAGTMQFRWSMELRETEKQCGKEIS